VAFNGNVSCGLGVQAALRRRHARGPPVSRLWLTVRALVRVALPRATATHAVRGGAPVGGLGGAVISCG
jgi:hypothetical protein